MDMIVRMAIWLWIGIGVILLIRRDADTGLASGGQMAAIWFLTPVILWWWFSTMGMDPLAGW